MKRISINVSEQVYRDLREHARRSGRMIPDLIREAIVHYRDLSLQPRESLRKLRPQPLGEVLKPLSAGDDLLGEMLEGEGS